ncbi:uncharacterized protein BDZ99DRAFT_524780 [Mytilinidion resinicola]|uniref:Uncharacterized protein n=1 Tax=Mytilinidion resinicola TaxID=574789 RepID=A0A6A6Y893_9PEZI|nr:uncharacterized protein BDZ99DRAFT_524780 [Mytilinidion resinicola]KAF2805056.1 hypothetical protein BDZ99DRAFT_524780 [Mytilinidion resinicola]
MPRLNPLPLQQIVAQPSSLAIPQTQLTASILPKPPSPSIFSVPSTASSNASSENPNGLSTSKPDIIRSCITDVLEVAVGVFRHRWIFAKCGAKRIGSVMDVLEAAAGIFRGG